VLKPKHVHMSCVSDASNTESESNLRNGVNACAFEWYRAWVCRASKRMVSKLEHVSSLDSKNETHKVRVIVNYQQVIAQAVRRGNVNRTPEVTRKMLKRGCRYVRCCAILWGGGGLIQIARLTVRVLYRARHGRYKGGIM
jgi:hypothetical protein